MTKLQQQLKMTGITKSELASRTKLNYRTVCYACKTGVNTTRLAKIYARALECSPLDIIEL